MSTSVKSESKGIQPVWVVVTGLIRDESFLLERINFLKLQKELGHIDKIVFSTWIGELPKFPKIQNEIKNSDFVLVESIPPELTTTGHYIHQVLSLHNALKVCPDNSFVLRTRTDKCGVMDGFVEDEVAQFLEKKKYLAPSRVGSDLFCDKIGIFGSHTHVSNVAPVLFFWNDRFYFGLKLDLLKLINYNYLSLDYGKLIPEQVLFAGYFYRIYPGIELFYKAVNQFDSVNKLLFSAHSLGRGSLDNLTNFLIENTLFRYAYISERYLLHRFFYDFPSGFDFDFNTVFRGVEIRSHEEVNDSTHKIWISNYEKLDFTASAEQLTNFLSLNFDIAPVSKLSINSSNGLLSYFFDT
jgi:hypothetical protein